LRDAKRWGVKGAKKQLVVHSLLHGVSAPAPGLRCTLVNNQSFSVNLKSCADVRIVVDLSNQSF